ncbi:helix-turn-helix domain-containing protein [Ramlibacter humi]|uniref:GAF domain-containing protein n=1 Tax=Ramlibacter humi TaxID=2530451 RepID=A0A4Z0BQQ0_9BURK|nr:helix-turn-helix domain-containing protein [Ramlibacter humi]TFZ00319.1 GAF domain-containing protein [Ramlibacter humi]
MQAASELRLREIERARHAVMAEGRSATDVLVDQFYERSWIERSWRRCLAQGQRPDQRLSFDVVSPQAMRRTEEASHTLVQAARPVMSRLARAIAGSRYFAVLTDAQGTVVGVDGAIDRSDRRAGLITRVGVDLSERAVGTTAIGAALAELQPVWLHRGEHFFDDTGCYSCAGAPVIGPHGRAVGMLDLTGIDAAERPELKHLVVQSARGIENALALSQPHALVLRLNWPGRAFGDDDGLLCLDGDGGVVALNPAARQMLGHAAADAVHAGDLFAASWETFFDAAGREGSAVEVPLWSGLTLQVLPQRPGATHTPRPAAGDSRLPLKDLETELIRKAVRDARGNVMAAAKALGISRATVYRKLGNRQR